MAAEDIEAVKAACAVADLVRVAVSANDGLGVAAMAAVDEYADKVRTKRQIH